MAFEVRRVPGTKTSNNVPNIELQIASMESLNAAKRMSKRGVLKPCAARSCSCLLIVVDSTMRIDLHFRAASASIDGCLAHSLLLPLARWLWTCDL